MSASYVLIWVIVAAGGSVSSGATQFRDEPSCVIGKMAVATSASEAAEAAKVGLPKVATRCIQTGLPPKVQ